jgi:hypothetical protein
MRMLLRGAITGASVLAMGLLAHSRGRRSSALRGGAPEVSAHVGGAAHCAIERD